MDSFLRGVEVWRPSADGSRLEFADGLQTGIEEFAAESRNISFARGEGLPGLAWATATPVVMPTLDSPQFVRRQLAEDSGLVCGIAVPLFSRERLTSVITLLFSREQNAQAGAIEVWGPNQSDDLVLADGYYGSLVDFGRSARQLAFAQGRGLPGLVRAKRAPVVVGDLTGSEEFVRAHDARLVGLRIGLGLPCFCPGAKDYVVTFLSGSAMPIAHRFEIWAPNRDGSHLVLSDGQTVDGPMRRATYARHLIGAGEGSIGRAWRDGVPHIVRNIVSEPVLESGIATSRRSDAMMAIPLFDGTSFISVVAFYL